MGAATDLTRIVDALKSLEAEGYVVGAALAETTSGGWDEVNTRGDGSRAVFWNEQAHAESFDSDGRLVAPLPVHWAGDASRIEAALQSTGLVVVPPEDEDSTFSVEPKDYELPKGGRKMSELF